MYEYRLILVCVRPCMCVCVRACVHACVCACVRLCVHDNVCVRVHVRMFVCMRMREGARMCEVCQSVCLYICPSVSLYCDVFQQQTSFSGTMLLSRFTDNGLQYQRGRCSFSGQSMPTIDGDHVYNLRINRGENLFAGQRLTIR